MILGLDVSSSCTGWAVVSENGKLIDFGAVVTRSKSKFPNMFKKIDVVISKLEEIKDKHDIKHIYIEEILNKFLPGKSSAKTITTLARFNGAVSYKAHELWGLPINYVAATTARKLNGIRVPRGSDAKTVVLSEIVNTQLTFVVEWTKKGNIKKEFYDMADAIVIAYAGLKNATET